ncbi:MAG: c-type cytochrome [Rhodocyclales bacterium]|nr:c-type cytochrome [Rhodocyclales bacterium]
MRFRSLIAFTFAAALPAASALADVSGKDIYAKTCSVCHATGIASAPRYGHAGDWSPRLAGGSARLYANALKGTAKGMPPKGGNPAYSDAEIKAAVDHMLAAVKDAAKPATPPKPAAKDAEPKAAAPVAAAPAATPAPAAAPVATVATADALPAGDVNAFNRLLKPVGRRNPPPPEDGIHDPGNDGTHALLPPLTAYAGLPKSFAGNRVNWVEAIGTKKINPRWDRADPAAEPVVMDLNIVREVKGSMPDVVYPHKQHTEWLDCSNCHPAIFIPQKGANAISMASILLGEKCGVCHGKVAFPVSECRLCHSKKKDLARPAQTAAGAAK